MISVLRNVIFENFRFLEYPIRNAPKLAAPSGAVADLPVVLGQPFQLSDCCFQAKDLV